MTPAEIQKDPSVYLGVLTRDPRVLGDAELAHKIEARHLPPLAELLAAPGVDEIRPGS